MASDEENPRDSRAQSPGHAASPQSVHLATHPQSTQHAQLVYPSSACCSHSSEPLTQVQLAAQRSLDRRQRMNNVICTAIGASVAIIAVFMAVVAHEDAQTGNTIALDSLLWTQQWEMYKYCADLSSQRSQLDLSIFNSTTFNNITAISNTSVTLPPLSPSAAFLATYEQDYQLCQFHNITALRQTFLGRTMLLVPRDYFTESFEFFGGLEGASSPMGMIILASVWLVGMFGLYWYQRASENKLERARGKFERRKRRLFGEKG